MYRYNKGQHNLWDNPAAVADFPNLDKESAAGLSQLQQQQ